MNETNFVICKCNVCSGQLEFDRAHSGETIQCPHCGMETILFAPIERVSEPPTNPPRRKLNFSWKRNAIAFIALFAIVAFITYQIKKATQEEEKKWKIFYIHTILGLHCKPKPRTRFLKIARTTSSDCNES